MPKLIEPGVRATEPLASVPLPESKILALESDALEVRVSVALSVPEVVGEKVTDRFVLPPASKV